ncbi:MAG: metallophosphoesterase [Pseudomonadales bacterium]
MNRSEMTVREATSLSSQLVSRIESRLGVRHARQRLGIEAEHESQVFGGGMSFFHPENWYSAHALIRGTLRISGMLGRARRNAHRLRVVHNHIVLKSLPAQCDGLRILHLSDLHIDMSEHIVERIVEAVAGLEYDLCVLTGDYRFRTYGNTSEVVAGMSRLREHLHSPTFAVLGNHDSVRMLPDLEDMGIHLLMNEHFLFHHNGGSVYIAGIDDAHFFGAHNIAEALSDVPWDSCSVLLSHTPEVYRQAAHAGADLLLCGHTHGGQICLPGGYPLTLDARIPRSYGHGAWQHATMLGYTSPGAGSSIVDARFNCPPEVTVHRLSRGDRVPPNRYRRAIRRKQEQ